MKTENSFILAASIIFLLMASNSAFADETTLDGHVLKVIVVGSGVASVGENRCSGYCSFQYPKGKTVSFKAVPAQGWTFVGWEEDCAGAKDCTLLMDSDKTVTALFTYP